MPLSIHLLIKKFIGSEVFNVKYDQKVEFHSQNSLYKYITYCGYTQSYTMRSHFFIIVFLQLMFSNFSLSNSCLNFQHSNIIYIIISASSRNILFRVVSIILSELWLPIDMMFSAAARTGTNTVARKKVHTRLRAVRMHIWMCARAKILRVHNPETLIDHCCITSKRDVTITLICLLLQSWGLGSLPKVEMLYLILIRIIIMPLMLKQIRWTYQDEWEQNPVGLPVAVLFSTKCMKHYNFWLAFHECIFNYHLMQVNNCKKELLKLEES